MSGPREDAESCSWSVCPGKQLTERNIGTQPLGHMGSFNHSTNVPGVRGNVLGTKELLYQKEEG